MLLVNEWRAQQAIKTIVYRHKMRRRIKQVMLSADCFSNYQRVAWLVFVASFVARSPYNRL